MKNWIILIISFMLIVEINAQSKKFSREDYIALYKDMAISEMMRTGVPASIKLAQGMIETGNGNSRLAVKANNHFGIKCHSTWKGKRIYHDDDDKGECFRRYQSVSDSYRDHSDFLKGSSRYSFLFELDITDYKGWAMGLQKAGYATSPTYASVLIRVIEENELYRYDQMGLKGRPRDKIPEGTLSSRTVYQRNRVKFIIAEEGDTFEGIRKEMKLLPYQIHKYNEIEKGDSLYPGKILYIQPKRNKAEAGMRYHTIKQGESMYDISQHYAIKLSRLYDKNLIEYGEEPEAGTELSLRRKIRGEKPSRKKKKEENIRESEKMEFEFTE